MLLGRREEMCNVKPPAEGSEEGLKEAGIISVLAAVSKL